MYLFPNGIDNIFKVKNIGTPINRFAKDFKITLQKSLTTLCEFQNFKQASQRIQFFNDSTSTAYK
jgi:hypothetical protein